MQCCMVYVVCCVCQHVWCVACGVRMLHVACGMVFVTWCPSCTAARMLMVQDALHARTVARGGWTVESSTMPPIPYFFLRRGVVFRLSPSILC